MNEERNESGQWLPGVSGNPDGKPEGAISILPFIRRKLAEIPEGERRNYAQVIADRIVRACAGEIELGEGASIRDLLDRLDGKPVQVLQTNNSMDVEWFELMQEIYAESKDSEINICEYGEAGE